MKILTRPKLTPTQEACLLDAARGLLLPCRGGRYVPMCALSSPRSYSAQFIAYLVRRGILERFGTGVAASAAARTYARHIEARRARLKSHLARISP